MKFHIPSFLIGCAVGASTALTLPRLRPLLVELAAAAYRFVDAVAVRTAIGREGLEDILAEARARAREHAPRPAPTAPAAARA